MGHKLTDELAIKQIHEKVYDESRKVDVTDYWCPNYPGDQIELRIYIWERDGNARVCMSAWGMDDDYMVLHSEFLSPVYAISLYKTWKEYIFDRVPDGCDHEWFFEHGFYYD